MASVSARVQPIDRDVELLVADNLSPQARQAFIADFARSELASAEQQNRQVLGTVPDHKTFVDGTENGNEDDVRSVIVYEFELLNEMFAWIADQLQKHSPVRSGRFQKSFQLFADGAEVSIDDKIPEGAQQYTFINSQPYARKIESRPGYSKQAPDGVFQAVADLARSKFGNQARIQFVYVVSDEFVTKHGDHRTPAIVIARLQ